MTETEIQRMVVRLIGDAKPYEKACADAVKATNAVEKTFQKANSDTEAFGKTIDALGSKMNAAAGQFRAMAALQSPVQMIQDAVKLAGQSETSKIEFGTMLQDDGKGAELVKQIQRFASDTPLAAAGIERVARTLLQFQVAQEDLLPIMKQLGDAAGGNQDKFARLALAFGQMRGTGQVTNEELNQMREAGFYPLAEMAKIVGRDVSVMKDEIAKGNVPFRVLEQALKDATSAGGRFNDGMARASKGLEGLTSTMGDDLDSLRRTVGEFIVDSFELKEGVKQISEGAKTTEKAFSGLHGSIKGLIIIVGVLVASLMFLAVTWKIGSSMIGIVIANYAHMTNTFRWVTGACADYTKALIINTGAAARAGYANATLSGAVGAAGGAMRAAAASSIAFKAGLLLAVYAAAELINALAGGRRELQGFNDEMKRSAELDDRLAALHTRRAESRLGGILGIEDIGARTKALEEERKRAENELTGINNNITASTRRRAEMDTTLHYIARNIPVVGRGTAAEIEGVDREIGGLATNAERARAELQRVTDELKKINEAGGVDPQTRKAFGELTADLEKQLRTFGMTAEQARIYELELKGITQAELASARAIMEGIEALKKRAAALKTVADIMRKMEEDYIKHGMSDEDATLAQLAANGATAAQLETARAIMEGNRALKENAERWEAVRRITEQSLTPVQQYEKKMAEIVDLRRRGMLTEQAYIQATDMAAAQLNQVQAAADKAAVATKEVFKPAERVDATLRNSAEALTRIAAFRDANQRNPDNTGPDWRAFGTKQQQDAQTARETLKVQRDIKKVLERSARQNQGLIVASNTGSA